MLDGRLSQSSQQVFHAPKCEFSDVICIVQYGVSRDGSAFGPKIFTKYADNVSDSFSLCAVHFSILCLLIICNATDVDIPTTFTR